MYRNYINYSGGGKETFNTPLFSVPVVYCVIVEFVTYCDFKPANNSKLSICWLLKLAIVVPEVLLIITEAVALEPPPPDIVATGNVVYPVPALFNVILTTLSESEPVPRTAVAIAPVPSGALDGDCNAVPPPPVIVTVGTEVYPEPLLKILILSIRLVGLNGWLKPPCWLNFCWFIKVFIIVRRN